MGRRGVWDINLVNEVVGRVLPRSIHGSEIKHLLHEIIFFTGPPKAFGEMSRSCWALRGKLMVLFYGSMAGGGQGHKVLYRRVGR